MASNQSEIRIEDDGVDRRRIDPFLVRREKREKGAAGGPPTTESRMERTTKSWIERQQLIVASRGGGHYTLQEERELVAAESERKQWLNEERKRRKVANAAVRVADKHKKEKEQDENENIELNSMINSLPEMFRNRVMAQVKNHRERATSVAEQMKGTSTSKMRLNQFQMKKMEEKKRKQPIPIMTELFHESGFNAHIERCRASRIEKEKLQKKATSTHGTWAPGHTIVKQFSF
jgi:hypothetical protein